MEFTTGKGAPMRDHAVVKDASVVKKLDEIADKMMLYRSDEQKLTDHHQATGFASAGPVAFGQFEVGRSSMPQNQQYGGTYQFKATTARGIVYPHMNGFNKMIGSDPGAYDPDEGSAAVVAKPEIKQYVTATFNRSMPAFNARQVRNIGDVNGHVPGKDAPGPGQYQAAKAKASTYRKIDSCNNQYKSNSLQRPKSDTAVPGPGTYRVNNASVEANIRDSGAAMRSTQVSTDPAIAGHPDYVGGTKSFTGPDVGPATYEQTDRTIGDTMKYLQRAQSSHKPGFGTKSAQRQLPFEYSRSGGSVPEPGAYQPSIWTGRKVGTKVLRTGS